MVASRKQAFAKAKSLNIEIDCNNSARYYDATMWAPDGKVFDGSGCSCFSLQWGANGSIGYYWQELMNEMELVPAPAN